MIDRYKGALQAWETKRDRLLTDEPQSPHAIANCDSYIALIKRELAKLEADEQRGSLH